MSAHVCLRVFMCRMCLHCVHLCTCTHVYMSVLCFLFMCFSVCMYTPVFLCVCFLVHMSTCVFVYAFVCMCFCLCQCMSACVHYVCALLVAGTLPALGRPHPCPFYVPGAHGQGHR